jgi:hypothetical protein
MGRWRTAGLLLGAGLLGGAEVRVDAPLGTLVTAPGTCTGGRVVEATVTVPPGTPGELGVGAWAGDIHGRWFGQPQAQRLGPGTNQVRIALPTELPIGGPRGPWTAADAAEAAGSGLFLWSQRGQPVSVRIDHLRVVPLPPSSTSPRLLELACAPQAVCGQRWQVELRPDPYPADPYDPEAFALDLVVAGPDGQEQRLPGFHRLPMTLADGGDREQASPDGPARFCARWRPERPGRHLLRLEARWADHPPVVCTLPPVEVAGTAIDAVARLDPLDRRFLQVDGRFW